MLLALAAACATRPPQPFRVLFVGNSLTYYNDLPARFAALYTAAHPRAPIQTDMLATGGGSLRNRLDDGHLATVLAQQRFDVVVLQDVGGWPLCPPQHLECENSPQALQDAAAMVRQHGARPIWYATWQQIPEVQQALSKIDAEVATQLAIEYSDVGFALQSLGSQLGENPLRPDGHPNPLGTWLAAATLLVVIEPISLPVTAPASSCGYRWEASNIQADRLASEQSKPARDCQSLSEAQWAAVRSAAVMTMNAIKPTR